MSALISNQPQARLRQIASVVFAFGLLGQAYADNFLNCKNGYYPCDASALTDVQREEVRHAFLSRNLFNCRNGYYPCDQSLLTSSQAHDVYRAFLSRNFVNCKNGYYPCDSSVLTAVQAAEVRSAYLARNLFNCKHGYYPCTQSELTAVETEEVRAAYLVRNLYNCKNGYYPCDESQLTVNEHELVRQARAIRDAFNCAHGYSPCAAGTVSPRSNTPINASSPSYVAIPQPTPATASTTSAAVAENGSYYGQPNVNGVPKTVYVHGYYRKDGTYVQSHYRSPPGSNPPSHRKK